MIYNDTRRFDWYRGFQVGKLTWGRQSYRFSDHNFEDNKKDGHGNDWPIRYKDPQWYGDWNNLQV
jgi:choline dehydrogenase-like flavoprotein